MKHDLTEQIRDAGYEALFHLGGFLVLSLHPTQRNQERIFQWIDETQSRRQQLHRLEKRGLIEAKPGEDKTKWVGRLTALGRAAFAGGRDPEAAWDREWDGKWRLLTFDLPRQEHELRMVLRRWLVANFIGQVQGSVWIGPDAMPGIEEMLAGHRIDSASFMVFEGAVAGEAEPREVAGKAWDFAAINSRYRRYTEMATNALKSLPKSGASAVQLRSVLAEDRKLWWAAVRRDPLLPRILHPKDYEGTGAWKVRAQLMKKLGKAVSQRRMES